MKKYTEIINESFGFGVFTSFSKCLTALNFKNNEQSKSMPNEFIIYYNVPHTESDKVRSVFSRFKSLSNIEIKTNTIGLYFGIKSDSTFEYGIYTDSLLPIGTFPLNTSKFNSIKLSQLKSLLPLKKSISDLTFKDIQILGKIKKSILEFNPGNFQKKEFPPIQDRIISFGYYGLGSWNNGIMDENSIIEIKNNFKEFIADFKWSDHVLINVKSNNFWTYLNIKLKS